MICIMLVSCLVACNNGADKEPSETNKTESSTTENSTISTETTEESGSSELEESEESTEQSTQIENNTEEIDSEEATEEKITYTYNDLDKEMYVTSGVNVRDLPSRDGEKLGELSKGDKVEVTGKCNETGWYRIKYKNTTAYVSAKYLSDTKPKEESSTSPASENNNTNNEAQGTIKFTYTENGSKILPGWELKDGVWYPIDLMPGGKNYDAELHAEWDGKKYAEFKAANTYGLATATPDGGLVPIPNDYVIGSFAIYQCNHCETGELILFCMGM